MLKSRMETSGVLRLTLDDQASRNALSQSMMNVLGDEINSAASDKRVRVIIIGSSGPVFCSGHDLKEVAAYRKSADGGKAGFSELIKMCSQLMQQLVRCEKPVIAEIDGLATAAGCQLVASCDLAVASENAEFCTPGVNIGLFCSTPMVALSRNLARKHCMQMLLTGEPISGQRAFEIGLVNMVVPSRELMATTLGIANKISEKSRATIKRGKSAFYHQLELNLVDAYKYASNVMVENMLFADAEEGISAFLEKRNPFWGDK